MYIPLLFTIIATLILVGFLSNAFFYRIKIPDSVILIFLGILLGPVTGFFHPESFLSLAGLMASIAIMVIMFEAGLTLDIKKVLHEAPQSFLYATSYYSISSVLITISAKLLLGWDWIYCAILGVLLGGTSAAIVIPLVSKIEMDKEEKVVLELESTFTNVYNVILALSLAQIALAGIADISATLNSILGAFAISMMLGGVFGIAWQYALKRLGNHPFAYTLTLAMLMYLYAFTEFVHANGPLAALTFGLVLSNVNIVSPLRTVHLIQLHREISFFIRVFFFVYLGVIFSADPVPVFWIFAGIVSAISVLTRYTAATLIGIQSRELFAALIPRGLSEAVVISILMQMDLPYALSMLNITSATIIFTNVVSALLVFYVQKYVRTGTASAQGS